MLNNQSVFQPENKAQKHRMKLKNSMLNLSPLTWREPGKLSKLKDKEKRPPHPARNENKYLRVIFAQVIPLRGAKPPLTWREIPPHLAQKKM